MGTCNGSPHMYLLYSVGGEHREHGVSSFIFSVNFVRSVVKNFRANPFSYFLIFMDAIRLKWYKITEYCVII